MSHATARSSQAAGPRPEPGPLSPRNRKKADALGLTSATGLVIGSIIGTGVFTMPAVLAGAGATPPERRGVDHGHERP
jgi:APA family basic amino acid/polyamine antiporter